MRIHTPLALCLVPLCLASSTASLDLDVGIPPGSPIEWGRRFPGLMPLPTPPIPLSQTRASNAKAVNPTSTVAVSIIKPTVGQMRMSSTVGLLNITTWDMPGHIPWLVAPAAKLPPATGQFVGEPGLPSPDETLYWASMVPLLRLMLHPQMVSRAETIAHLVEIGEPVEAVLPHASTELSLAGVCSSVSELIEARRSRKPVEAGANPRETMLRRFLSAELVRQFPYDPNGNFGERFFLMSAEVEPLLVEFAEHADSFLRRNAVAALGRIESPAAQRALNRLAAQSKDAVVVIRALAALGHHGRCPDAAALITRLRDTDDEIIETALVVALGRCRSKDALADLLERVDDSRHPDMQLAGLVALARIGHDSKKRTVAAMGKRVERRAVKKRAAYKVEAVATFPADIPDAVDLRAEIIGQAALLLRANVDPTDRNVRRKVLALGKKQRKLPKNARRFRRAQLDALGLVSAPLQMLYLDTLRRFEGTGQKRLEAIARNARVMPELRAKALSVLALAERAKVAEAILDANTESIEMRISAFEVLLGCKADKAANVARELLKLCARSAPEHSLPSQRYLWRLALRTLAQQKSLDLDTLRALLPHVRKAKARPDSTVFDRLRRLITSLVDAAAKPANRGLSREAMREKKARRQLRNLRIDKILSIAIRHRTRRIMTEEYRPTARSYIEGQLKGLAGDRGASADYRALVRQAVFRFVTGKRVGGLRNTYQQDVAPQPVVLLEQEILFALGRLGTEDAAKLLVEFVGDEPRSPLRAQACLAMGMSDQASMASFLIDALGDADGFVRFCAYEGLRRLTRKDYWADWIYGSKESRAASTEKYLRRTGRRTGRRK